MAISVARRIAFEGLLRVETQGAYADEWLHARLADTKLKREDAALATELVMGTLRWQRLLDFLLELQLDSKSKGVAGGAREGSANRGAAGDARPRGAEMKAASLRVALTSGAALDAQSARVARLDAEVREALRMGLYQLRWLERVPARAAVHESVELVKRARKASAAGLVNAVLRNAPSAPAEELIPSEWPVAERMAVLRSHPTWLVERWIAALGEEETRALLAANNSPPRVTCAVAGGESGEAVTRELKSEGVVARPGRWLRGALEIVNGVVARTRAFREGRVRIQDEASQMVALLLDVRPGMRVLDVCAAPGGKTLALAEAVGSSGSVVAADLHARRLTAMRERVARYPQVHRVALDAAASEWPLEGKFDAMLVDVPCSGTGTLARHPEIRWRLRAEDLAELRARQTAILLNAAVRLRTGGRLVYSTCSLEPEENEQVVEAALQGHSGFELESGREALKPHLLAGANAKELFDSRGYLRTWPQRHGTDGFFAAVVKRKGG